MPSVPPSALRSHVYKAITGCYTQVRPWPPDSCRAEVNVEDSLLCLVFSAFYPSGLSCGTLTSMPQHRASHTNKGHSCVFGSSSSQASNWTRENICTKMSVISQCHHFINLPWTLDKHAAVCLTWFSPSLIITVIRLSTKYHSQFIFLPETQFRVCLQYVMHFIIAHLYF